MRIITWNCQMGFGNKASALLAQDPDIAVVPECSEKSVTSLQESGYKSSWFGSNCRKGLAVFCRKGWSIRQLPQPEQKWIVPLEIDAPTPFTLLAVWACRIGTVKAKNYVGQVYEALMSHPEWFSGAPVVLAGDLNSNTIWDGERPVGNHSAVVRILADHGLVSVYHEFFGELQGAETRSSFYFYRHADKPFHIDYIFIPRQWLPRVRSVSVGAFETWSKLSDHCPVIAEIV
jgi:exodeoxyribonuclease III